MSKSDEAFRTISEVSDWLDTPAHVLRFWESKFSQIRPVKRAGGRRYYRPEDMALLGGIKTLLHEEGMTIKGVQKLLREQGVRHVAQLSPPVQAAAGGVPLPEAGPGDDPAPDDDMLAQEGQAPAFPDRAAGHKPDLTAPAAPAAAAAAAPAPAAPAAAAPGAGYRAGILGPVLRLSAPPPARRRARIVPLVARLAALRARMAGE